MDLKKKKNTQKTWTREPLFGLLKRMYYYQNLEIKFKSATKRKKKNLRPKRRFTVVWTFSVRVAARGQSDGAGNGSDHCVAVVYIVYIWISAYAPKGAKGHLQ